LYSFGLKNKQFRQLFLPDSNPAGSRSERNPAFYWPGVMVFPV